MKYHVYGKNKPIIRSFVNGKYKEYRTSSYSGHRIADTMEEAIQYMQEYFNRNWDVQLEIR